jgi:outer membrane protein
MNPRRTIRSPRSGWIALLAVLLITAGPLRAQEPPAATLSLADAIDLARRNNPDYLANANDATSADWAVREAYGSLLPSASVGSSLSWQDAGTTRFGILTAEDVGFGSSTSYYSSSYNVSLNYQLSGASILAPGRERAGRRATEAGIDAARHALEANVTRQYLALRGARDGVRLAEDELLRTEENLRLASARAQVGAVAQIEAAQAEVDRGRAEVALLQARNLAEAERLRLMQVIGIELDRAVTLTTDFAMMEFAWTLEDLLRVALEGNPQLGAARASENASDVGVKMARTAYLPSLSLSAGFSGFARQAGNVNYLIDQARAQTESGRLQCMEQNDLFSRLANPLPPRDCSVFMLTRQQEERIRESNSVFPFDFTRDPLSLSLSLQLPIFEGFSRERQVEEAKVAAQDARHRRRGEELRVRLDVSIAFNDVETARQSVALEERNQTLADDQLRLARERYRLGAGTFLELREAETVKARADRSHLSALYQFHEGLSALEAAVGRPLRPLEGR